MPYEQKPGQFSLFKNDNPKSERSPEYTGSFLDQYGVEHWVSAWVKESQAGKKFFSGTIRPKDDQPSQHDKAKANGYQPEPEFDDEADLPF